MCGRFVRSSSGVELFREFGLSGHIPKLTARYNIAPSQMIDVIVRDADELRLGPMRWGIELHPGKPAPINARAETVAQRFREPFARRRCLIPADGFYEWAVVGGRKVPHFFRLRSRAPFGFAGIWTAATDKAGERIGTFALVTCEPNDVVRPVHDRMPVIIARDGRSAWLDPATSTSALKKLLAPVGSHLMEAWEVSPAVNSPRNDSEECVKAVRACAMSATR